MRFFDAAANLIAIGMKVIPLVGGQKRPLIEKWQTRGSDDEETIAEWAREWPTANVGIVTGSPSGILVIDVDVKSGKDGFITLAALAKTGKRLPPAPTAITASGGRHVYFKMVPGIRKVIEQQGKRGLGVGLDVMAAGAYIVAPPSVLIETEKQKAGKYRWLLPPVTGEFPELPSWAVKMLADVPAVKYEVGKWDPDTVDQAKLRVALFAIDPGNREIWCEVGMAIKNVLGEGGRGLWDEWSAQSEKFEPREQDRNWRTFGRPGYGAATIFHYAKHSGWR